MITSDKLKNVKWEIMYCHRGVDWTQYPILISCFQFFCENSWKNYVVILALPELPSWFTGNFWKAEVELAIAWGVESFSRMKDVKLKLLSRVNKNRVGLGFPTTKQNPLATSLTDTLEWILIFHKGCLQGVQLGGNNNFLSHEVFLERRNFFPQIWLWPTLRSLHILKFFIRQQVKD